MGMKLSKMLFAQRVGNSHEMLTRIQKRLGEQCGRIDCSEPQVEGRAYMEELDAIIEDEREKFSTRNGHRFRCFMAVFGIIASLLIFGYENYHCINAFEIQSSNYAARIRILMSLHKDMYAGMFFALLVSSLCTFVPWMLFLDEQPIIRLVPVAVFAGLSGYGLDKIGGFLAQGDSPQQMFLLLCIDVGAFTFLSALAWGICRYYLTQPLREFDECICKIYSALILCHSEKYQYLAVH